MEMAKAQANRFESARAWRHETGVIPRADIQPHFAVIRRSGQLLTRSRKEANCAKKIVTRDGVTDSGE